MKVEDRPDYFDILETYAQRLQFGYKCLVDGCGKLVEPSFNSMLNDRKRSNFGNLRGAMTNHLKGHMRRGEI